MTQTLASPVSVNPPADHVKLRLTHDNRDFTLATVIRPFRSRALAAFWNRGDASRIRPDLAARVRVRLDALHAARRPQDLHLPGFDFHRLRGHRPTRYSIHGNGPWAVTFEWDGEDAVRVDLEQYHGRHRRDEGNDMTARRNAAARAAWEPTHPGALLRDEVLPALKLTVKEAAEKLDVSRQALHNILAGKAAVTPEMALRLGKLCGNGPGLWLRMQQERDLWRAERAMTDALARIPTLRAAA